MPQKLTLLRLSPFQQDISMESWHGAYRMEPKTREEVQQFYTFSPPAVHLFHAYFHKNQLKTRQQSFTCALKYAKFVALHINDQQCAVVGIRINSDLTQNA